MQITSGNQPASSQALSKGKIESVDSISRGGPGTPILVIQALMKYTYIQCSWDMLNGFVCDIHGYSGCGS